MVKKKNKKTSEETITLTKTAMWQIVSGVFAVLFLASVLTGGFGTDLQLSGGTGAAPGTGEPSPGGDQPQPGEEPAPGDLSVDMDNVRTLGDEDAPVTLVEYSDFTCPFCGQFYNEALQDIKEQYVEEGLVQFVYKDFPVVGGEEAAEAGWCAEEQGEFWDYHDYIFENQEQINSQNLRNWAGELGLDQAEFEECMDEGRYADRVQAEAEEGLANGIQGTPGFVINEEETIAGAQPFQQFQQVIDSHLN